MAVPKTHLRLDQLGPTGLTLGVPTSGQLSARPPPPTTLLSHLGH